MKKISFLISIVIVIINIKISYSQTESNELIGSWTKIEGEETLDYMVFTKSELNIFFIDRWGQSLPYRVGYKIVENGKIKVYDLFDLSDETSVIKYKIIDDILYWTGANDVISKLRRNK